MGYVTISLCTYHCSNHPHATSKELCVNWAIKPAVVFRRNGWEDASGMKGGNYARTVTAKWWPQGTKSYNMTPHAANDAYFGLFTQGYFALDTPLMIMQFEQEKCSLAQFHANYFRPCAR